MEISGAKRLRELESENTKLKRFLAETELGKAALKKLVQETSDGRASVTGRGSPQGSPCQRAQVLPPDRLQSICCLVPIEGSR